MKASITEGMEALIGNRYARSVLTTLFVMGLIFLSFVSSGIGPLETLKDLVKELRDYLNFDKSAKRSFVIIIVVFIVLLIILPFYYVCDILWGPAAVMALLILLAVSVAIAIIIIASNELDAKKACPLAKKSMKTMPA